MNLNKIFYDWSNEVYVDRNNLVFEGKNQAYGAYQIRQEYNKVLVVSMIVSLLGIALLVSMPNIIQYFKGAPIANRVLPPDEGPIAIDPDLLYVKPIIPSPEMKQELPKTEVPTVENIIPVVVNKPVVLDDRFATNAKLLDSNSGTVTNNGKGNEVVFSVEKPPVIEVKEEETIFYAEKMPSFIGGDEALFNYMRNHVRYPELEKDMGISGTVYVSFIINKQGRVEDAKIARGVKGGKGLDNEALRVISEMPLWEPGMQNHRAVKVQFTYPVNFVLR